MVAVTAGHNRRSRETAAFLPSKQQRKALMLLLLFSGLLLVGVYHVGSLSLWDYEPLTFQAAMNPSEATMPVTTRGTSSPLLGTMDATATTTTSLFVAPTWTQATSPPWMSNTTLAIAKYRAKVERARDLSKALDDACHARHQAKPTVFLQQWKRAVNCLQQSCPANVTDQWSYPHTKAHAHFNTLRWHLAAFAQHEGHKPHEWSGFAGPWIENQWITSFEHLYDEKMKAYEQDQNNVFCLSDLYGPYIPIFVPWTDLWVANDRKYPAGLWDTLMHNPRHALLRKDVLYVAVVQNAQGLTARTPSIHLSDWPSLLILSAGGYGHVPIPLLKQEEDLLLVPSSSPTMPTNRTTVLKIHPPSQRKHLVSFVGRPEHAPRKLRRKMIRQLKATQEQRHALGLEYFRFYYGEKWRYVMAASRFSLAPRGFGRTSYHYMEALQMGLIPLFVYSDQPWIPYFGLMKQVLEHPTGLAANLSTLTPLLNELETWSDERIQRIEQRIATLRDSHFRLPGVMHQIHLFLTAPANSGDLVCQALPSSERDAFDFPRNKK